MTLFSHNPLDEAKLSSLDSTDNAAQTRAISIIQREPQSDGRRGSPVDEREEVHDDEEGYVGEDGCYMGGDVRSCRFGVVPGREKQLFTVTVVSR